MAHDAARRRGHARMHAFDTPRSTPLSVEQYYYEGFETTEGAGWRVLARHEELAVDSMFVACLQLNDCHACRVGWLIAHVVLSLILRCRKGEAAFRACVGSACDGRIGTRRSNFCSR